MGLGGEIGSVSFGQSLLFISSWTVPVGMGMETFKVVCLKSDVS